MIRRAFDSRWGPLAAQGLLLLALIALAFPAVFLQGELAVPGGVLYEVPPWSAHYDGPAIEQSDRLLLDIITAMHTYYALAARAVEGGEWPLWNHLEMAGIPLLANYQSATLYLPRILHAFLPELQATSVFVLLKLWLCGMTAFLCGLGLGMSRVGARLLSVAWMLGGYCLVWCYWPLTDQACWLPAVFLGVEWIAAGRRRAGFAALVVGASFLLLAGHPETGFIMGLGAGLYFLLRQALDPPGWWAFAVNMGWALGAWALALGLAAGQIVPFLEYLVHSHTWAERPNLAESEGAWLPLSTAIATWVPRFFGTVREGNFWGKWNSNLTYMLYPGVVAWLGVGLAVPYLRDGGVWRSRVIAVLVSVAPFLGAAFNLPGFAAINALPPFNAMFEHYHVAWPIFAITLLGVAGLDRWLGKEHKARAIAPALAVIVLAVAAIALAFWINSPALAASGNLGYAWAQAGIAAGFAVAGLAALLSYSVLGWRQICGWLVTAVLAAELLIASRGLLATCPEEDLYPPTALTDHLRSAGPLARVYAAGSPIPGGVLPVYGVEQWVGYDGIYPARIMRFQQELGADIWNGMEPVCAITHYLQDARLPPLYPGGHALERVASLDGIDVYANPQAYSRAYLVGGAQVEETDALFHRMKRMDFDPRRTALVEKPLAEPLPGAGPAEPGRARVRERTPNRVVVEAEATGEVLLVLSEAYFPGWTAHVDGEKAEVIPVFHAFRGVRLGQGSHVVEFRYAPVSFRVGLTVSLAACGVSLALAWRLSRGRWNVFH